MSELISLRKSADQLEKNGSSPEVVIAAGRDEIDELNTSIFTAVRNRISLSRQYRAARQSQGLAAEAQKESLGVFEHYKELGRDGLILAGILISLSKNGFHKSHTQQGELQAPTTENVPIAPQPRVEQPEIVVTS